MNSESIEFKIGQRIWFSNEVKPYHVKSCNDRFAVCTKPFNLRRTVQYTIIDLNRNVRGTENLVFCFGFETVDQCNEALERLKSGETEVSYRNFRQLDILRIDS